MKKDYFNVHLHGIKIIQWPVFAEKWKAVCSGIFM